MGWSGSRMGLVGDSSLMSASGGWGKGVEVGWAIASFVFGCVVHVWRVLGSEDPGVVDVEVVVWKGGGNCVITG